MSKFLSILLIGSVFGVQASEPKPTVEGVAKTLGFTFKPGVLYAYSVTRQDTAYAGESMAYRALTITSATSAENPEESYQNYGACMFNKECHPSLIMFAAKRPSDGNWTNKQASPVAPTPEIMNVLTGLYNILPDKENTVGNATTGLKYKNGKLFDETKK